MSSLDPDIATARTRADVELWAAFARSRNRIKSPTVAGKLLFPAYRGGALRVGEQEAR